jgi:predicted small secreted protein
MKKTALIAAALASALSLAACNTPGDRAAGGAILGGATGAAIGAAATGRAGGALAGAAIGAASGAVIGAATTPRQCAQVDYDAYGNPVCVAYY